jgi:microcystin-dependent protein
LAIDFPNSPTTNQDYTVGTTTWTYDGAKWVLKTYNSLHAVPVTAMMLWANTTYPTGWLLADGSAISRVTYADLFAAIGTTYGVGDGSTTFNLPNMVSAGADSPNTIIKVTNSGALEPSAISHAANHTEGGSDVVTVTGNQIANYQTYRNIIINGGMSVAQRGTSTASITGISYYTADRWRSGMAALFGTWTQSVENDAPAGSGFSKSLKMLCTTANASLSAGSYNLVNQLVEGQNLQYLSKGTGSAKTLVLSFWVKSNVTGNYVFELYGTGSRQISKLYNIAASGVWEKKTITFAADTTATGAFVNDNTAGLEVNFWLVAGSLFSSGTLNSSNWANNVNGDRAAGQTNLAAATSNYWQVTGVQLEAGSVATPFEFEPFETTLRKCQRYYQTIVEGSTNGAMGIGTYYTASQIHTPIRFPVVMRAAPTMTHVSGTNYYTIYRVGAADSFDGWLSDAATPYGIELYTNTGIAGTAGDAGMVRTLSASAYVAVSAEL